jgi:hypothetical protein
MSSAARSLFAVGSGLIALGLLFAVVPALALPVLGLESAAEPAVRILGVVVAAIGGYYVTAAGAEDLTLFRASVLVRSLVGTGFLLLIVFGVAHAGLLVFVALEYAGAMWTGSALWHRVHPRRALRRSAV